MKHQKLITTPETSARMAKVHLKGSKTEIALAKNLWKHGLRYRKNYKKLPGISGHCDTKAPCCCVCRWGVFAWEILGISKSMFKNQPIVLDRENRRKLARDRRNDSLLIEMGWIPVHFWEKDVNKKLVICVDKVLEIINTRKEM